MSLLVFLTFAISFTLIPVMGAYHGLGFPKPHGPHGPLGPHGPVLPIHGKKAFPVPPIHHIPPPVHVPVLKPHKIVPPIHVPIKPDIDHKILPGKGLHPIVPPRPFIGHKFGPKFGGFRKPFFGGFHKPYKSYGGYPGGHGYHG